MEIVLAVNDLVKEKIGDSTRQYRILWIDEGNIIAYIIDIDDAASGVPEKKKINDMKWAIMTGEAKRLEHDPLMKVIPDEELSDSEKKERDTNLAIITPLIEKVPDLFRREIRGKMIQETAQKNGVTVKTVYSILRRYWRRGQNKTAVVPDNENKGGRGKPKKASEKKRGRPRLWGTGINADAQVEKNFAAAYEKYHLKEGLSLPDTHKLLLRDFYGADVRYDEKGRRWVILDEMDNVPSLVQLRYWREKDRDYEKEIRAKYGDTEYDTNRRPVLGSSTAETFGPGSRFQIDATVGDVYLVSRHNREWIIGRPVIYILIDVFSRMIVGFYVGLEGPSWLGAAMALANTASDKVKFCEDYRKYDVNIVADDWPCHHLPRIIVSDRGEMAGKKVEPLLENLGVFSELAAPYRPDWKGIVENQFNLINQKVKPIVPGTFDRELLNSRVGPEYRLDARLDIEQFTAIMILYIVRHNRRYMRSYDLDPQMIADGVKAIPLELWRWGLKNRSGRLQQRPENLVKLCLMPTDKASITKEGIKFKNMRYTSVQAIKDKWFEKAANRKAWKEKICYDPRNMNYIYIPGPGYRSYEVCRLMDHQAQYRDRSLYEIEYWMKQQELVWKQNEKASNQDDIDLMTGIDHIVEQAVIMTEQAINPDASKASRLKGIRKNREMEKQKLREEQAFDISGDKTISPGGENITTLAEEDGERTQPNEIDFLTRKQRELQNVNREGK